MDVGAAHRIAGMHARCRCAPLCIQGKLLVPLTIPVRQERAVSPRDYMPS